MAEFRVTTVDLLRHGACEGGEIFRGSTDVALSDKGWEQMRSAVQGESGWSHIVCSDLRRCREFGHWLGEERETPVATDARLREIHFGDWEGQKVAEVRELYPKEWRAFFGKPSQAVAPNGEAMVDFHERITPAIGEWAQQLRGQHFLVVAHGAVIRSIMVNWLQMPLDAITSLSVPYAGMSRFKIFEMTGTEPWAQLVFHRG
ncbi:histidine phosphatase family protein [Litorivivens sp.]|uniref:histidine phosphatase family protein n=1 Tax=Litorivivens sp. TaxID=2020868 RepID=UPI0035677FC3